MEFVFVSRDHHGGIGRLQGLILAVCLSLWLEQTSEQESIVIAFVGQTITLSAPVTVNILNYSWYRGTVTDEQYLIRSYVAFPTPSQVPGNASTGRETELDNGTLQIRDVRTTDRGSYRVSVTLTNSTVRQAIRELRVYGRPNGRNQCSATGLEDEVFLSCFWPGGNPPAPVQLKLSAQIPQIDDDKDEIPSGFGDVVSMVSRSDLTPGMNMTCHGVLGRSDDCTLIFDAPHAPGFTNGSVSFFAEGKDVCLEVNLKSITQASSVDILPATFIWSVNSSSPVVSGGRYSVTSDTFSSLLKISNSSKADSGDYLCQAENLMGNTNFSFAVNVSFVPGSTTAGGLSARAIAGIVVGVVTLLLLIGVTVFCVLKRKKDKQPRNNTGLDGGGQQPADSEYSKVIGQPSRPAEPENVNVNKSFGKAD